MEDYQKEALSNCLIKSWVAFEPLDVTNYLLENAILNGEEVMKIRSGSVPWARVQLLVSSLRSKTENTFEAFLTALTLCGKYDELINELETSAASLQKYNRKVEELIQSSSPEENFMFLDMVLSVADSLDTNDSLKLCKHFSIADEWIDTVKKSKNPGLTTMNICRRIRIVTFSNIQTLRDALSFLSLVYQLAIVERYIYALTNHELELVLSKTEPEFILDRVKEMLHDKTLHFKIGRKLCHILRTTYHKTSLADIKAHSGVFILKVPTITSLNSLHRDLSSSKLATTLLPLLLTTEQDQDVGATDEQNPKITLALNEHIYKILKFHFEKLAPRNRDDPLEGQDDEATNKNDYLTLSWASGPEITVTITRTDPNTLLARLRTTINDKQNVLTKGRPLRVFFYQYFEDISCAKICEGSNGGASFVLRVSTVSGLHQLHRAISKGKLAEDMLSTVQHTVGDKLSKNARMCMKMDEDEYRNAQVYFETATTPSGSRESCVEYKNPTTLNQGSPSGPLYVDPESFEMIQQMRQERQDYDNALLRSGSL